MRARWTDLAMESRGAAPHQAQVLTCGVERTVVRIRDEETARRYGRPQGTYVTLSCPQELSLDLPTRRVLSGALAEAIRGMMPENVKEVLVVGLGNRAVTPDALGPRTVERILVTRHMRGCLPEDVAERLSSVCAIAPGVLGVTGIETAEALIGMVQRVKPDAMIAIDALAARSSGRICSTIQIADTGITPGSGVGNHQRALTEKSLGVPVIAVGVPMVVYASTIAADAMEEIEEDDARLHSRICGVVSERLGDLIVTPREVDALVERMAGILAEGINGALHPQLTVQEIEQMTAT